MKNFVKKNFKFVVIGGVLLLLLIIIIIFIIIKTNKITTLNCTLKEDTDVWAKINTNIEIKFKNNKIKNVNISKDETINEEFEKYTNYFYNSFGSQYYELRGLEGVDMDTTQDGNKISFKASINMKKLGYDKVIYPITDVKDNYKKVKNDLTEKGYACK